MNENKAFTIIIGTISICVMFIVISFHMYYRSVDSKIESMVKSGADPIAASIALDNIYASSAQDYYIGKLIGQSKTNGPNAE